jgi:hypothetical protein
MDSKLNMLKFEKEGSKFNMKTKTSCYFQNLMFDNWVLFKDFFSLALPIGKELCIGVGFEHKILAQT